jgi:hypothetical protein
MEYGMNSRDNVSPNKTHLSGDALLIGAEAKG